MGAAMPCCYVAVLAKQRTAGVAPLGAGDAVCLDGWGGLSLSKGRVALVGRREGAAEGWDGRAGSWAGQEATKGWGAGTRSAINWGMASCGEGWEETGGLTAGWILADMTSTLSWSWCKSMFCILAP